MENSGFEANYPPMHTSKLRVSAFPNNPLYLRAHTTEEKSKYTLHIAIHPLDSDQITVIYPGANESYDGLKNRYKWIAYSMQIENLSAVVRSSNPPYEEFLPDISLRQVLNYTRKNAEKITGNKKPDLILAGYSSGASAIAAIGSDYPNVTKMLLIAPSSNMPLHTVAEGLRKYTGELYVAIGENEDVVNPNIGHIYMNLARNASEKKLFVLPNCEHFFYSHDCDKLFSDMFLYTTNGIPSVENSLPSAQVA